MAAWHVKLTPKAEAELKDLLQTGEVTKADVKVLLRWLDEMEEFGPEYIADSREWHDHELTGDWKGFRSSAFSSMGRVIYKIEDEKIIVVVHKVTADHDYARK